MGADGGVCWIKLKKPKKYNRVIDLLNPFYFFTSMNLNANWQQETCDEYLGSRPEICSPNYLIGTLILDDDQKRLDHYRKIYESQDHIVTTVKTYIACIHYLRLFVWDLIHLDYDLDHYPNANTFIDGWGNQRVYNGNHIVADMIDSKKIYNNLCSSSHRTKIVVHSTLVKGKQMVDNLNENGILAVWEPFDSQLSLFDG